MSYRIWLLMPRRTSLRWKTLTLPAAIARDARKRSLTTADSV